MRKISLFLLALGTFAWAACEEVDVNPNGNKDVKEKVELEDVAKLLSEICLGESQLSEVYEAVNASSDNGYDEEYMMCDLFAAPGSGVGSAALASKSGLSSAKFDYEHPLRELIREGLEARANREIIESRANGGSLVSRANGGSLVSRANSGAALTKTGSAEPGRLTVEEYLDALESSDIQIYWPYSENWDGTSFPVITFDPNDGSETNVGWIMDENGEVVEVLVDEDLAQERPVWVVNRNDDSGHTTLEMLRKTDPDWGNGGGTIIIGRPDTPDRSSEASVPGTQSPRLASSLPGSQPSALSSSLPGTQPSVLSLSLPGAQPSALSSSLPGTQQSVLSSSQPGPQSQALASSLPGTKASTGHKMLLLKSLTMYRNYDSWFAGASEFVIKMGSADGFNASTEAELKLFIPTVTDFVIVVRRNKRNKPVDFNAVLVSDWTDQIENCVLLVTEDDGGAQTSWKCSVTAKLKSKSYGFDIDLPYRQNDDLVWRGSLSRNFIEANNGKAGHFGDIDLVFEFLDY